MTFKGLSCLACPACPHVHTHSDQIEVISSLLCSSSWKQRAPLFGGQHLKTWFTGTKPEPIKTSLCSGAGITALSKYTATHITQSVMENQSLTDLLFLS